MIRFWKKDSKLRKGKKGRKVRGNWGNTSFLNCFHVALEIQERTSRKMGSHPQRWAMSLLSHSRKWLNLPDGQPFRCWSKDSKVQAWRFQNGYGCSSKFQDCMFPKLSSDCDEAWIDSNQWILDDGLGKGLTHWPTAGRPFSDSLASSPQFGWEPHTDCSWESVVPECPAQGDHNSSASETPAPEPTASREGFQSEESRRIRSQKRIFHETHGQLTDSRVALGVTLESPAVCLGTQPSAPLWCRHVWGLTREQYPRSS